MARFAFISDIHGNLSALEAVLAAVRAQSVDATICLGDVVGYGPFPSECLDLVKDRCALCVMGNHDRAVIDATEAERFNPSAREALDFTCAHLATQHVDQIRDMPMISDLGEVTASHASPITEPTDYVHDQTIAAGAYGGFDNAALLLGHTHIPIAFGTPDIGYLKVEPKDVRVAFLPPGLPLRLDSSYRYILNPGSVGQPRDGNPDASFGVLDATQRTFTVYRVAYDVQSTQDAMIKAGLPNFLAQRLRIGA